MIQQEAIWNARIDHFPGVIVRAAQTSDIAETINFARINGVELSVRAGGHNHAGYAVSEGRRDARPYRA